MKILVVAATKEEVAPILKSSLRQYVDFLITGVGMVATAFHLGRRLAEAPHYDLVLNVGIAGAIDKSLPIGSVVNITEDTFSEMGAEDQDNWISITDLGFGTGTYQSYYNDRDPELASLQTCKAITVNRVHGNEESIQLLKKQFPWAQIESMEGAAVFYAAQQTQLSVLQIRSISNLVEPRKRENWNIPLAIQSLNDWLARFIASKIHE
jgi:futalosine hydrolase